MSAPARTSWPRRLLRGSRLPVVVIAAAFALPGCRSLFNMDPGASDTPARDAQGNGSEGASEAGPVGQDAGAAGDSTAALPVAQWDVVFSEQGEEVYFNGQRVPASNLRREADAIEVVGHDGSIVKRISLPAPPHGQRPRSFLGAQLRWVSPALASHLGIDPKQVTEVGAILRDGPAAQAGFREHDVIVQVDGVDGASPDTIRERLAKDAPGTTVAFTLLHGSSRREVVVTLGAWRHQPLPSAPIRSIAE